MAKLLTTQITPLVLYFKVENQSDSFAACQMEVWAAGVEAGASPTWYQQAPDMSAKIPPGDRTEFSVTVLDVPPVRGGFVGSMTLTVRVFSVELRQEDRQVINLVIEGSGIIPPQIDILSPQLVATPQTRLEIPVRLYNPNRSTLRINLSVQGLPPEWLTDGQERRLEVPAQGEVTTTFLGQIGSPLDAPSQVYPFDLEARVTSLVSQRLSSQITVLPAGTVALDLTTPAGAPPQETRGSACRCRPWRPFRGHAQRHSPPPLPRPAPPPGRKRR